MALCPKCGVRHCIEWKKSSSKSSVLRPFILCPHGVRQIEPKEIKSREITNGSSENDSSDDESHGSLIGKAKLSFYERRNPPTRRRRQQASHYAFRT